METEAAVMQKEEDPAHQWNFLGLGGLGGLGGR